MAVSGSPVFQDAHNMMNVPVSIDRGVHSTGLAKAITGKGGLLAGTIKYTQRKQRPVVVCRSPNAVIQAQRHEDHRDAIHFISEYGTRGAYWIEQRIKGGSNVFILAYRNGHGKVVHLSTTDPNLGPQNWVFERSEASHKPYHRYFSYCNSSSMIVEEKEELECLIDTKVDDVEGNATKRDIFSLLEERNVDQMTTHQRDQIWFELRMFRITSNVAYNIIKTLFDCSTLLPLPDSPLAADFCVIKDVLHMHSHQDRGDLISRVNDSKQTIEELKLLCRQLGIANYSASLIAGGREGLIKFIIDTFEERDSSQYQTRRFNQSFLSSWCLAPQNSSTAMYEGINNEQKVLDGLQDFLIKHGSPFQIEEVCSIGLLVDQDHEFIGTSADGLMLVKFITQTSISIPASWNTDSYHIVALEIKTRVSISTQRAADKISSQLGKFSICDATNNQEFAKLIPHGHERAQLAHHSVAIKTSYVLYTEASTTGIIRSVLVHFSVDFRDCYTRVLDHINTKYFSWIADEKEPVPSFSMEELGYFTDTHTLAQRLSVWRAAVMLFKGPMKRKPYPFIRAILPALICYWNTSKGFVDVITRTLTIGHSPFHHIKTEAALWLRMILLVVSQTFAVAKCAQVEASGKSYSSTDALSKDMRVSCTFAKCIAFCLRRFRITGDMPNNTSNTNNDYTTVQELPQVPISWTKHTKIATKRTFFNSREGVAIRSVHVEHVLVHERTTFLKCIVCKKRTTTRCLACMVYLCGGISDRQSTSCNSVFHDKSGQQIQWKSHYNDDNVIDSDNETSDHEFLMDNSQGGTYDSDNEANLSVRCPIDIDSKTTTNTIRAQTTTSKIQQPTIARIDSQPTVSKHLANTSSSRPEPVQPKPLQKSLLRTKSTDSRSAPSSLRRLKRRNVRVLQPASVLTATGATKLPSTLPLQRDVSVSLQVFDQMKL